LKKQSEYDHQTLETLLQKKFIELETSFANEPAILTPSSSSSSSQVHHSRDSTRDSYVPFLSN